MTQSYFSWPAAGYGGALSQLEGLSRRMDRMFSEKNRFFPWSMGTGGFPAINVTENDDGYTLRSELPGIKSEDLDISVTGKTLTLSGERKIPKEEGASFHRQERKAGRFNRTITLPGGVDAAKVTATCKNGLLTITLPKEEAAKPRSIKVTTG